jgi:hypothetical protein
MHKLNACVREHVLTREPVDVRLHLSPKTNGVICLTWTWPGATIRNIIKIKAFYLAGDRGHWQTIASMLLNNRVP